MPLGMTLADAVPGGLFRVVAAEWAWAWVGNRPGWEGAMAVVRGTLNNVVAHHREMWGM